MKNLPKQYSETRYLHDLNKWTNTLTIIVSCNFNKFKEMKENQLKMRCIKFHTAFSDGDFHNIKSARFYLNI
jgi:hypothetical protein